MECNDVLIDDNTRVGDLFDDWCVSIDSVRDVVMNAWKLVDNLVFLNELYFSNGSYRSYYCIA
jgi:hypothetical protein